MVRVLNSCPIDTSDGPDLRCAFEIASHDPFSCNSKANGLVTLSNRRSACKSHAGGFEIGVFSLSLCWLVDGMSRAMLVSGWHPTAFIWVSRGKGVGYPRGWPLGGNRRVTARSCSCE